MFFTTTEITKPALFPEGMYVLTKNKIKVGPSGAA